MAIVNEVGTSIYEPIRGIGQSVISSIPNIVGAILVLIVGYVFALIVGWLVRKVCDKIDLDKWLVKKTNFSKILGAFEVSNFLGLISKWYTFILFLPPAATVLSNSLLPLADLLNFVALWVPNVIAAAIIGVAIFLAAEYVREKIVSTKVKYAESVANLTKGVIVLLGVLIVLRQLSIQVSVAESSFLIILGGLVFAVALALGLGFGLALKDEVKPLIKEMKKKF